VLSQIALGILKGVCHIHSFGILHRDLKPQNVLLDDTLANTAPVAKIADLGEARDEDLSLTMTYVFSPLYVSPELYRGERYGMSTDIYGLGVLLNEIDTGNRPNHGEFLSSWMDMFLIMRSSR